jgi:UDP-N-acetylglucosamine 2-epimerase (non-hydrolysing)
MDVGAVIMSGLRRERVIDAVQVTTEQYQDGARILPPVVDYEAGAVSKKILRVVMSYTDYINRTVWSSH